MIGVELAAAQRAAASLRPGVDSGRVGELEAALAQSEAEKAGLRRRRWMR